MIKLIQLKDGRFRVESPELGVYAEGPLATAQKALSWCEVHDDEIVEALEMMAQYNHNCMTFGVNRQWSVTSQVDLTEVA